MMNSYDDADLLPACFGFEYRPGQAILIHPFPLPVAEPDVVTAAMAEHFAQLVKDGNPCWGLGLMFERFSSVEQEHTQYRLTVTDDGDPSITGIVIDMHGNSYHAVMPKVSTDNFGVRSMTTAGHHRTLTSNYSIVHALEAFARALPQMWHTHIDPQRN
ncbi:hypothetical protein [Nocardia wallacei]|uniref:hypothetical protein n=1 Tax=Nocardia wallacei TaxID=480035 RepID=UPI0024578EA1|nr:hypothetical protein [Nocardia wallacei]